MFGKLEQSHEMESLFLLNPSLYFLVSWLTCVNFLMFPVVGRMPCLLSSWVETCILVLGRMFRFHVRLFDTGFRRNDGAKRCPSTVETTSNVELLSSPGPAAVPYSWWRWAAVGRSSKSAKSAGPGQPGQGSAPLLGSALCCQRFILFMYLLIYF